MLPSDKLYFNTPSIEEYDLSPLSSEMLFNAIWPPIENPEPM